MSFTSLLLLLLTLPNLLAFEFFDEKLKPGSSLSSEDAPQAWLVTAAADWMSSIPDSTPLHELSIPGTHDAGSLFGTAICETQSWSILEQLDAGIRYLDIRNRRAGQLFAIHHGVCFQKIFFGGVMEQIAGFLNEHPREAIIMRVKEEHDPKEGSDSFQTIWDRYMGTYKKYFLPDRGERLPTLGEARGKILVLRNANFKGYGILYDGKTMEIQDYYKVYATSKDHPFGPDTASLRQKKAFMREFLVKSAERKKLVLNHWSCTNGMLPITCARATNYDGHRAIGPYKKRKTTGVVIMDYPGDRLIFRIIKTNFESAKRCEGKSWRAQSDRTYAEFRVPGSALGTIRTVTQGAYHRFVFPKCHRATWSDLRFECRESGWTLSGSLDADGGCVTYNEEQPLVKVGHR